MNLKSTILAASAVMLASPALAAAEQSNDTRIAALESQVANLTTVAQNAANRAQVENLFGRYMTLHNAFRDPEIVPLWVKKGHARCARAVFQQRHLYRLGHNHGLPRPAARTRRAS